MSAWRSSTLTLKHGPHASVLCSLGHMTKSGTELLCSDSQVFFSHHLSALLFCLDNHLETCSCCSVKTPNGYPFRSKTFKNRSQFPFIHPCVWKLAKIWIPAQLLWNTDCFYGNNVSFKKSYEVKVALETVSFNCEFKKLGDKIKVRKMCL